MMSVSILCSRKSFRLDHGTGLPENPLHLYFIYIFVNTVI